ncbi:MAG: efflux RND transporter periplasmic adaptor subunit [Sulfurimonadaceae bacterium]|jgi:macrolide-specific efflux system membrane fusion protein|nr:efflux RND transporter periplasmic adaptor subunit [Sulfurimonadaceae bacterium]
MKKMKKWLLFGAFVALFVGGTWGYLKFIDTNENSRDFETIKVVRGDIENIVTATGKLAPRDYVDVGAQVSGQLKKLHVEIGDKVVRGQLLAEIDVTLFMAKVDQQRAQLKYQQSSLKEKEARLELAKIVYEREENLYKNNATSLEKFQNASLELQSAQAQRKMIQAQIEQIESSLRAEEANLEFTRIYAPMDGTVVNLSAKQGQTLNANQQAPTILQIADLTIMTLKAEVSESDVMRLRPGMEVYFKTLGREKKWHSKLDKVEPTPTLTNNVVLYNALFDIENAEKELMTSMTAQVFFIAESSRDTLLVPLSTVKISKDKSKKHGMVQILDAQNHLKEVEVELGISNRIMVEILSGLGENQDVIIPKPSSKNDEKEKKNASRPRMM